MASVDHIVRSQRVVLPDGVVGPAAVHIAAGRIAQLAAADALPSGVAVTDVGDDVVMAGLVDTHVHVNDPGRTDWEGFDHATRAAAAGGITTIVDMPLNCQPPTTTRAALRTKLAATEGRIWVDVGFWGGVVPGNGPELEGLLADGVLGFKCFLVDSGVPEFAAASAEVIDDALGRLRGTGAPLLAHAELEAPIAQAIAALPAGADMRCYARFLDIRPPAAEQQAIDLLIGLCRKHDSPVHIVHLSSAAALASLRAARAEGLPLTVETCPHYLYFAAEQIADGATHFKCVPPIRAADNREQLWRGLAEGVIDHVVSDHSPCLPALKRLREGNFATAWGGIASLQLSLAVTWTQAEARGHTVGALAQWMSAAPAQLAGLGGRKGTLAPGCDADLVIWRPGEQRTVAAHDLQHRHPITPYDGLRLHGVVQQTWLRGQPIYAKDQLIGSPRGQGLRR